LALPAQPGAHRDQVQGYKSAHAAIARILHIEEQDREALARLHSRQAAETISLETRIENLRHARHYEGLSNRMREGPLRSGCGRVSAAHALTRKKMKKIPGIAGEAAFKAYPHINPMTGPIMPTARMRGGSRFRATACRRQPGVDDTSAICWITFFRDRQWQDAEICCKTLRHFSEF